MSQEHLDRFELLYHHVVCQPNAMLKKLYEPIEKLLETTYFSFERIYDDGRYVLLSTRPSYIEYYIQNKLFLHDTFIHDTQACPSGLFIHPILYQETNKDSDLDKLTQDCSEHFQIKQQLVISEKFSGYYDAFCFGTDALDHRNISAMIQQMQVINRFMYYFRAQSDDLIRMALEIDLNMNALKGEKFLTHKSCRYIQEDIQPKEFCFDRYPAEMNFRSRFLMLTPRETECLHWTILGKSATQIGEILKISPRTVETYRENVRSKLGVHLSFSNIIYLIGKYGLLNL